MRSSSLMPGAFSGTLLESDLLAASAPGGGAPAFLGSSEDAGAACDPAIFLVDDPEPQGGPQAASTTSPPGVARNPAHASAPAPHPGAPQPASLMVPQGPQAASARDLLRELESSVDFILPGQSLDSLLLDAGDGWHNSPPAPSPGTPAAWQATSSSFPAIPEEAELALAQLQLAAPLPGVSMGADSLGTPAFTLPAPSPASMFVPVSAPVPSPAPTPAAAPPEPLSKLKLPGSPVATTDAGGSSSNSEAASPTASSASSLQGLPTGGGSAAYPRIASMPNLHLSLSEASSGSPAPAPRRRASGRSRAMPRSHSHSDLATGAATRGAASHAGGSGELERYNVPHLQFLTPPHLRKGKGGRQPAIDPRLDPSIDPKRARRIMANRLSAAKSKMKQKSVAQAEAQRAEMLRLQREGHLPEGEPMEVAQEAPAPRSR